MHETRKAARPCRIECRDGAILDYVDFAAMAAAATAAYRTRCRWALAEMMSRDGWVDAFTRVATVDAAGRPGTRRVGCYAMLYVDGAPIAVREVVDAVLPRRQRRRHPLPPFRDGAVAHVGGRGGRAGFLRRPRTAQEIRRSGASAVDRAEAGDRRTGRDRDVPTAWDDIRRGGGRSWKRHRANRWRER